MKVDNFAIFPSLFSVFRKSSEKKVVQTLCDITGATLFVRTNAVSSFFQFHLCRARKLSFTFAVAPVPGLLHRDGNFGTEKNDTAFLTKKGTNKIAPVIHKKSAWVENCGPKIFAPAFFLLCDTDLKEYPLR